MNKQQEASKKFNEEFKKRLKEEKFPDELLPADFDRWKHASFQFESPLGMNQKYGISFQEYKVLLMKTNGFTLYEVLVIANTIEVRTPHEIGQMIEANYYDVQAAIHEINKHWNTETETIRRSVETKIEIMTGHKTQRGPNIVERGVQIINGRR
jgi:hypothetical protein